MSIDELRQKPLWQMTGEEFIYLQKYCMGPNHTPRTTEDYTGREYVFGIQGIASIFGCSISTANRIKRSGRIDKAIKQVGRKIVIDKQSAIELFNEK